MLEHVIDAEVTRFLVAHMYFRYVKVRHWEAFANELSFSKFYDNNLGAIQIIRDTFLAYFRPPSPIGHLVTLSHTPPPPRVSRII